jgi:hypothetical protein
MSKLLRQFPPIIAVEIETMAASREISTTETAVTTIPAVILARMKRFEGKEIESSGADEMI